MYERSRIENVLFTDTDTECGDSVVERRAPARDVGVQNLPAPCCVLEQDTLLSKSTGNTQEAMTPS